MSESETLAVLRDLVTLNKAEHTSWRSVARAAATALGVSEESRDVD